MSVPSNRISPAVGSISRRSSRKTTFGRTILRLEPATEGEVKFNGQDIYALGREDLKKIRRRMQIIFQDPVASLDPRTPIGDSIGEGLRVHAIGTPTQRREKV